MRTPKKPDQEFVADKSRKYTVNRRAFLRGAGAITVGLPFLEGLQERSAWAAGTNPVFTFFLVGSCGVVGSKFFPSATGAITTSGLAGAMDKAVYPLSAHAANMLFIKNVNYPLGGPTGCGHAQGLCQSLTATNPGGSGSAAYSGGPSADWIISQTLGSGDPVNLYAGSKIYIAERISFKASGAGQVRAADVNPYTLYSKLVGLTTTSTGTGTTTTADPVATELATTRKSVNDFVRAELNSLMALSALSSADKNRLQQHFQAIRDVEIKMGTMAAGCTKDGLSTSKLDALKSGISFQANGMIEDVVKLHCECVALAFACNYTRVAALQWGDGTDGTKYSVPSNASLNWPFHHISHRVDSDSAVGSNPTAENAHHEIDVLRMQSLAYGFDQFKARGLQDNAMVMWTNHISDGPSHSTRNVPTIIWGSGGGVLKQGQYVDMGGTSSNNNKLLATVITAACKDKSSSASFAGASGTFATLTV